TLAKVARSQAQVYISGESGTGKELAARLIHEQGPRSSGNFVPVNCGAIPSELMESEFFGHVKGSFTGAVADKVGLFEAAAGGTLFLDEVADLPLSMQVKLLRAIQEKAVRAVGSAEEKGTDVRVLSATHKDLGQEVAQGRFRQDLYYRLNVIELQMPSLRERASDIPELASQILQRLATEYGKAAPRLSDPAMRALKAYGFPGNVRELENVLERAFTLCEGDLIEPADLQLDTNGRPAPAATLGIEAAAAGESADPAAVSQAAASPPLPTGQGQDTPALPPGQSLEEYLEGIERRLIVGALEANRWNKTAAAKDLGITFRALRYRLKKLDLE
ncbi:MAG: sigma-54-dependent Fis family transcriptional regulator, partial [Pseudomonadales bacterium]|nr:sigma-54-dependent Fis family transcriptional regulator [Pseudomonadales bacterium]